MYPTYFLKSLAFSHLPQHANSFPKHAWLNGCTKYMFSLKVLHVKFSQKRNTSTPAQDQRVCCDIVSPISVRSFTYKVVPTWIWNWELNKANNDRHAKEDRGPLLYTKSSRQSRNVESGRSCLPLRRAHQLVVQYQMVSMKTYMQVIL